MTKKQIKTNREIIRNPLSELEYLASCLSNKAILQHLYNNTGGAAVEKEALVRCFTWMRAVQNNYQEKNKLNENIESADAAASQGGE